MTVTVIRHAWLIECIRLADVVSTGPYKGGPIRVFRARCGRCGETLPEYHTPPPWWVSVPDEGPVDLRDCEATP